MLLVRPGTDGALALAMLHVLDAEGLTDEGWLAEHAAGWAELKATLGPWTAERAGALTGLDPAAIRALALAYGRAKAPCIVAGSGFSRSGNGGEAARAIAALPAAVGAWARRGGGTYGFCSAPPLVDKGLMKRPWRTDPARQKVNINLLGPALLGEGELLSRQVNSQVEGDTLLVTLSAECREQIGRFVAIPVETPKE